MLFQIQIPTPCPCVQSQIYCLINLLKCVCMHGLIIFGSLFKTSAKLNVTDRWLMGKSYQSLLYLFVWLLSKSSCVKATTPETIFLQSDWNPTWGFLINLLPWLKNVLFCLEKLLKLKNFKRLILRWRPSSQRIQNIQNLRFCTFWTFV